MAKENFDSKIAPIRAWVAQMELDSMKERMEMGVKARLKAGKANTGQDRYGYIRIGENIHIVEEETKWIRQIFEWYIQKTPLTQIRKRLIAGNAPQKGSSIPQSARVTLSGAGSATLWVDADLSARIFGAGSVNYYGMADVTRTISGVGSVNHLGNK